MRIIFNNIVLKSYSLHHSWFFGGFSMTDFWKIDANDNSLKDRVFCDPDRWFHDRRSSCDLSSKKRSPITPALTLEQICNMMCIWWCDSVYLFSAFILIFKSLENSGAKNLFRKNRFYQRMSFSLSLHMSECMCQDFKNHYHNSQCQFWALFLGWYFFHRKNENGLRIHLRFTIIYIACAMRICIAHTYIWFDSILLYLFYIY